MTDLTDLLNGCDSQPLVKVKSLADPDVFYAAVDAGLVIVRYDGYLCEAQWAVREATPDELARITVHLTDAGRNHLQELL